MLLLNELTTVIVNLIHVKIQYGPVSVCMT